jgi:S1-C subfamily serine protease
MTYSKLVLLMALLGLIAACSVKYKVVGSFDNYNEVFIGEVDHNLLAGRGHIIAEGKNSKIRCEGDSFVTYIPPSLGCAGQRGKAPMICSDGRRLDVDWVATSCTQGHGLGKEPGGATFRFVFGFDESAAREQLTMLSKQVTNNPELPAYRPKEVRKERGFSTGTGFFITNDGTLVTNYHVVEGASEIVVVIPAEKKDFPATVLTVDSVNDVAVLKIDARSVGAPLAPYFNIAKGEEVFTLGYPLVALQGQEQKATFGRVNSLSGIQDDLRLVQIDVPIQPGNSGGPLINRQGEVVGVVTATLDQIIALRTSGALPQNVNFAVKIDYILPTLMVILKDRQLQNISHAGPSLDMAKLVALREPSVVLVIAK